MAWSRRCGAEGGHKPDTSLRSSCAAPRCHDTARAFQPTSSRPTHMYCPFAPRPSQFLGSLNSPLGMSSSCGTWNYADPKVGGTEAAGGCRGCMGEPRVRACMQLAGGRWRQSWAWQCAALGGAQGTKHCALLSWQGGHLLPHPHPSALVPFSLPDPGAGPRRAPRVWRHGVARHVLPRLGRCARAAPDALPPLPGCMSPGAAPAALPPCLAASVPARRRPPCSPCLAASVPALRAAQGPAPRPAAARPAAPGLAPGRAPPRPWSSPLDLH